ncbi:DNA topoisomerase I [Candidatus Epulonipiscium fishelsonii]|uniref:DNA topoisomerase I n=1 Tax=Candidatus Epulonipiscium fishelsonii TaxID=77094 RepID=A0ACC8XAC6_9FIRM|nr:DNA topoisomerase I [Epulopiscium sp. SCG-D08WGA-EpuloA1]OON96608.1 MAG: DNA topoisomerase I [Epulopiscium sp. AS2M-Bin002]
MAGNLVIVESAAKVNTISKFLGKTYKVEASIGHVRDLPKSQLGVDVENDYEPKYITIRGKGDLLQKLRKDAKNATCIYLATDPDREGEAISWHLYYALRLEGKTVKRITFNEITQDAVKNAIKNPRDINLDLVNSQQARRVLDRLVGYKISPILWKKLRKGLSAGRVQSVTLRLICDREKEIREFIEEEYWSIDALFRLGKVKSFEAKLDKIDGQKAKIQNSEQALNIIEECSKNNYTVIECKENERIKNTVLPFTTSTLQQEASKHLGFSTQKTMNIAQQLYEGVKVRKNTLGIVSYIRTDSIRISESARLMAKEYIQKNYGEEYLAKEVGKKTKTVKTQDAHEAIRPTHIELTPMELKEYLSKDQYRLYNLIWNRFTASQMSNAKFDSYSIKIKNSIYIFKATYSIQKFDGYLKVYNMDEKKGVIKPINVKEGEILELLNITPNQHFTQAPARFSEATIIKALEENGVGRPSTYAPTITTLLSRSYVTKEAKILYPTDLGEIVNKIMVNYFNEIVNVEFTAQLENVLDEIADGNVEWKEIIKAFYPNFNKTVQKAETEIENIDITEVTEVKCDLCGTNMVVKYGKYGKFLGCPNFPDCYGTKPWFQEIGINCPVCSTGQVILKKTKKGRIYYGCSEEACDFMSWQKPTGEKCPNCSDVLIEKGSSKNKKTVCRNSQCNYGKESIT